MVRKVYGSKYYHFSTFVNVNGKVIPIVFKGGFSYANYTKNGIYSTCNEDIQRAIESDKRFGREFFLLEGKRDFFGKRKKVNVQVQNTSNESTIVPDVSTVQEAKAYLIQVYGDEASGLRTKDDIIKFANEKNICFLELNK